MPGRAAAMKPILPSAVLILGCIAVASAQAPKPRTSDFFSRDAGDAPAKPKTSDFFSRGIGAAPPEQSPAPPTASVAPAPPIGPASITALGSDGLLAERVRYVSGEMTLTAARIEVRGTRLTREDLARLLDPAAPGDLRERLAAVKAREIVVPDLTITSGPAVANLRDIRLSDVGDGRIGSVAAGPGSATFGEAGKPGRAAFARFEAASVDADRLLAPSMPRATDDASTRETVFAGAALDDTTLTSPDGDVVRIARIAGRDYRSRRTAAGLGATFDRIADGLDKRADAGARSRGLAAASDLLGAFEIGGLEAVGIDYSNPRGSTGRIARIGLAAAAGTPGSVRLDGFETAGPDLTARIAAIAVEDISLRSLIDGMASAAATGSAIGPAEARRFVPQVGAIRLGRVEVVKGGPAAGTGSFTLAGLELATSDFVEGLPTRMRFAMRDLSVPVAALSGTDPAGQLAGLGYTDIATSVRADLAWSEASRQLDVHEIAFEGGGMGSAKLRAVVGNVSKDLFGRDSDAATRAALGAAAQSIDLDIQDRGLLDRILAMQARQQGVAAEDLRIAYAAYARLGIPEVLGPTMPGATELAQAVARFITKPGQLRLRAKATQAAGLSAADVTAAGNPATLLGRIDLTATTETDGDANLAAVPNR